MQAGQQSRLTSYQDMILHHFAQMVPKKIFFLILSHSSYMIFKHKIA